MKSYAVPLMARVLTALVLVVAVSASIRADIRVVPVEVTNTPAKFAEFTVDIKKTHDRRIMTISYPSQREQKVTDKYADGKVVEYYTEGVLAACQMTLYDENRREVLTVPIHFKKGRDGRSSARIDATLDVLRRSRISIYPSTKGRPLVYEFDGSKVK